MYMSCKMRVALFIYLDDGIEKLVYSFSVTADSRHNRHSEKITKLLYVQLVTLRKKFIIHVHGHDDPEVHVDKLGGEIEVSLKVRCIHHIDYHIRHVFYQILPDIEFFRTVCRKRICSREVDQNEPVSSMFERAFFCIHRNSAVVADVLMTSGSDIEEGGLAAVRISHQGYLYDFSSLCSKCAHLTFDISIL